MGFELEESAVAQTEKVLQETGDRVREEARRVMDEVAGLSGSGWQGGAMTAAVNKQTGDFNDAVNKLYDEINHISEALGLGRALTISEDQANEQALNAISPDIGNFSRL